MIRLFLYFLNHAEPRRRWQFATLAALIAFSSMVELGALGLLALFVTSLTSMEQVLSSRAMLLARQVLGPEAFATPQSFFLVLGLATMALMVAKNLLTALHNYATARFDGALNTDFGVRMLKGFLDLPYGTSAGRNSSEVMQIINWRICVGALTSSLIVILSDSTVSLLLFATLFLLDPGVVLLVVAVLGVVGTASFQIFRGKTLALGQRSAQLTLLAGKEQLKSLQGLRDVKLFNTAAESAAFFGRHLSAHLRCQAAQRVCERATVWVLETVGMGGLVLGSIIMIRSSTSHARMMGTLSLLAVSAWRILPAMYRSVAALGVIRGYGAYLHEVKRFVKELEQDDKKRLGVDRVKLPRLSDGIRFDHVSYAYGNSPGNALNDIDLFIAKGESVGIIGRSGAGKSTFIDVLTGLAAPTRGRVLVDGRLLDDSTSTSWRGQVGVVPQSPYLFDGSLAENISFTLDADGMDRDKVRDCCRQAGLDEVVATLPQGIDSPIGERAGLLSGGQAQRVAIARALYRNPGVLIFDEATSALDDQNAQTIQQTIQDLGGERTIIIIAHHLRAVRGCDRLIWLENGKVAAAGAPNEILPRYEQAALDGAGASTTPSVNKEDPPA